MLFSVSRSPIVGMVCKGKRWAGSRLLVGYGRLDEDTVWTTKPSGVTDPRLTRTPRSSIWSTTFAGALGQTGVHAQMSHQWLKREAPNAESKKWPPNVDCWPKQP